MKFVFREENIDLETYFYFKTMAKENYFYIEMVIKSLSLNKIIYMDYIKIQNNDIMWHPCNLRIGEKGFVTAEARLKVKKAWKNRAFL